MTLSQFRNHFPCPHTQFTCSQGRRKHQKIGGALAYRGTLGYRKGHLKTFSRKCWRRGGGGRKNFPIAAYRNCTFFTKFFKKTWKFPNKKGTFDVNLVFTATLACTKRALFITKKGTFSPLKNGGGGGHVPPVPPPPVPTPLLAAVKNIVNIENDSQGGQE